MGFSVRRNLHNKADLWRAPAVVTLTVDRSRFESPEHAHSTVTDGKFVPRLMRLLGVKLWFAALEFQTQTGSGWPHWHICIDLADLPRQRIDLARAWLLWRDTWRLGGLDLSLKREGLTVAHALNYITKYLTKSPPGGYPEWVLNAHTIRFVSGSRNLGPLVGKLSPREPVTVEEEEEEEESRPDQQRATNLDANSQCGLASHVMREEVDGCTGELRYRYLGTLPFAPGHLLGLSRVAGFPGVVSADLDPWKPERKIVTVGGRVEDIRAWCADHADPLGYRAAEVSFQREGILISNQFLNRLPTKVVEGLPAE